MKPTPGQPVPGQPAPGTLSSSATRTTLEDLRQVLEKILGNLEQAKPTTKQPGFGQRGEMPDVRRKPSPFWEGTQKTLRSAGGITGNQIADAIGSFQRAIDGLSQVREGVFGSRAGTPPKGWSTKFSQNLPQIIKQIPALPGWNPTTPSPSPWVTPAVPAPAAAPVATALSSNPVAGWASGPSAPTPNWSAPFLPSPAPFPSPVSAPITPPVPTRSTSVDTGATKDTVVFPTQSSVLPYAGLPSGGAQNSGSDEVQRQMLQVLQAILGAIDKLDQDDDPDGAAGFVEHESNRQGDAYEQSTSVGRAVQQSPGVHHQGLTPAQEEHGPMKKADDWLDKALPIIMGAL